MPVRPSKPVNVTLGPLGGMVRAGLRALEREEHVLDAVLKARVEEAPADPAPSIPQAEVFAALRAHHAARGGA